MTIENPPAFPTDGRIQHGTAYDGMTQTVMLLRQMLAGQSGQGVGDGLQTGGVAA